MPSHKSFGAWMRETRESRRMSAVECAEKAGMKAPVWSNWENDRSRRRDGLPAQPRRETLIAIARALEVSVEEAAAAAFGQRLETSHALQERLNPILDRLSPDRRKQMEDYLVKQAREVSDLLSGRQLTSSP